MVSRVLSISVGVPDPLEAASRGQGLLGHQGPSLHASAITTAVKSPGGQAPQVQRAHSASESSALKSLSQHFC